VPHRLGKCTFGPAAPAVGHLRAAMVLLAESEV
jgi:hypothetical protein